MVGDEILARRGEEALPVRTCALRQLLFARRLAEICRRAAHVVDVALEILLMRQAFGLVDDRLVRARLDDAPLVERQRAEIARAEAPAAARQAEFDLRDRGHAAGLFIARVIRPRIGQIVDVIHLGLRERLLRRILYDEFAVAVRLDEPLGREWVGILILQVKAPGIDRFVRLHRGIGRQCDRRQIVRDLARAEDRPVDVCDVTDVHSVVQRVCRLDDRALAHAVDQKVSL